MKALFSSDIMVLARLFAKKKYQIVVYDPYKLTKVNHSFPFVTCSSPQELEHWVIRSSGQKIFLINCSSADFPTLWTLSHVVAHLQFEVSADNKDHSFLFINNPDGTIRWIFPSTNRSPSHLQLYNASGWKAKAYRFASMLLFGLGAKKILASGSFTIKSKEPLLHLEGLNGIPFDQYSIFTGTVSTGRKAIMELSTQGATSHFLKIPIEEEANRYLLREFQELDRMKTLSFDYLKIPGVRRVANGILLDNIKPPRPRNSVELEPIHLDALEELYDKTAKETTFRALPFYEEISQNLKQLEECRDLIVAPLRRDQINGMIQRLNLLYKDDIFDKKGIIANAHGDFTPWNMYLTDFHVHAYDWELAKEQMPLLFDCFHFLFQTGILIRSFSWTEISQQFESLRQSPFISRLTKKHSIDFDIYVKSYLLYTISSYLPRYIRQKPLHTQAFWLIDAWEAALEDWGSNSPKIQENIPSKPVHVD